jgi:CBS domain-containing protein
MGEGRASPFRLNGELRSEMPTSGRWGMEKKVMNLMRKGALTCGENMTIREVAQIMVVNGTRYCVVTNGNRQVRGIISARSILRAFGKDLDQIKAKDILLPYTIAVTPNSLLKDAVNLMSRKKIEHVIVVSDQPGNKAVFGLLHIEDIVTDMAKD